MRPILTDRVAWSVGLSVTLVGPAKTAAPIQLPFGLRTWVAGESCIRWGPHPPMGRGKFWGENGRPILKYKETVQSSVQKWLNRSRCRLGFGLGWAQIIVLDGSPEVLRDVAMATNFWLLMGYNFGCMIASDTQFDSRGRFSGSSYPMKT